MPVTKKTEGAAVTKSAPKTPSSAAPQDCVALEAISAGTAKSRRQIKPGDPVKPADVGGKEEFLRLQARGAIGRAEDAIGALPGPAPVSAPETAADVTGLRAELAAANAKIAALEKAVAAKESDAGESNGAKADDGGKKDDPPLKEPPKA
ncbi:MAG: hypothetical protein MI755_16325 [Sphingomonadales bacterium]|nr:hypothetical protein [Sphingomonadales bacterium]